MILPVYAYGQRVLKKQALNIDSSFEDLDKLIDDMWEMMYHAKGIGLAAPQIGKSIRLFLIDTVQLMEDDKTIKGFKKAFINAEIIDESGDEVSYEEGCLSIPDIRSDVTRHSKVTIKYQDKEFNDFEESFDGITARVIQHEYDHIEAKLFTDYLSPLKKRLLKTFVKNLATVTLFKFQK